MMPRLLCLSLVFLLAACGGTNAPVSQAPASAPPASASGALQQLIEGAKKEPALKATWSASSFGGAAGIGEMAAAVNKKYGLNIKVTFTPGPDMQSVQAKIAQELAAGQPATSDIYLGNAQAMRDALETKTFKSIDWKAILERPLPADQSAAFDPYAPNGSGIAIASTITGITYNDKLLKPEQLPHKMTDLLNPELKGKIASTPYAAGWREFATKDMLGKEAMIDFLRKFTGQVAGLIRCGEEDRITSGEFWMLAMDCGGQNVRDYQKQGAPLNQVVLDDITTVHSFYAAVPANSSAPSSATLIAAYIDSAEGQALLHRVWNADMYTFPDSRQAPAVAKVKSAGGKITVDSPQWLNAVGDFAQTQKELQDILARKG
jgi:ABC-type Fe3+ transport system substrate-binding protein